MLLQTCSRPQHTCILPHIITWSACVQAAEETTSVKLKLEASEDSSRRLTLRLREGEATLLQASTELASARHDYDSVSSANITLVQVILGTREPMSATDTCSCELTGSTLVKQYLPCSACD